MMSPASLRALLCAASVLTLACAGARHTEPAHSAETATPRPPNAEHHVAAEAGHHALPEGGHHAEPAEAARASEDERLEAVAAVHGGAGPWAVAGYRMGEFALRRLGLPRGSFDLEVVHFTPESVQYSCIADGAAAATGASLGKLNLKLAEASALETRTAYRNRKSGETLTLAVTDEFRGRFADVPREELGKAGRQVLQLRDDEIFRVVP